MKQHFYILLLNLIAILQLNAMDPDNPAKNKRQSAIPQMLHKIAYPSKDIDYYAKLNLSQMERIEKAKELKQSIEKLRLKEPEIKNLPPLFQAIQDNDFSKVKEICDDVETYQLINEPYNGKTPLKFASEKKGKSEIIYYLICSGARYFADSQKFFTKYIPLGIPDQSLESLSPKDWDYWDGYGMFSLPLAYDRTLEISRFFSSDTKDKNTPSEYSIFQAIAENNLNKVKELVTKNKNIINETWHANDPLSLAFEAEAWQIAQYLIEQGANIHTKLVDGMSLLEKASQENQREIVQLLRSKGLH